MYCDWKFGISPNLNPLDRIRKTKTQQGLYFIPRGGKISPNSFAHPNSPALIELKPPNY